MKNTFKFYFFFSLPPPLVYCYSLSLLFEKVKFAQFLGWLFFVHLNLAQFWTQNFCVFVCVFCVCGCVFFQCRWHRFCDFWFAFQGRCHGSSSGSLYVQIGYKIFLYVQIRYIKKKIIIIIIKIRLRSDALKKKDHLRSDTFERKKRLCSEHLQIRWKKRDPFTFRCVKKGK